jgi:hypothetical protein
MAPTKKATLKAKKARKQKMILAVGGVLFVVVLAIQAPRILKMVHGGGGESTAAPYKAFPADALASAGVAEIAVSDSGTMVLPDRDPQPEPAVGQLVDFELFSSKDPFVQQVKVPEGGEPGGADTAGSDKADADKPGAGGDQKLEEGQGGQDQFQEQEAAPSGAVISINGAADTVQVGGKFPAADPTFVLVSATKSSVRIGIAGGSLATGADTVTLTRGKTLTLVNTIDGTEYRLRLVSTS